MTPRVARVVLNGVWASIQYQGGAASEDACNGGDATWLATKHEY